MTAALTVKLPFANGIAKRQPVSKSPKPQQLDPQRSLSGSRSRAHGLPSHVSSKLQCEGNGRDFALAETMEIATIFGSFEGIVSLLSLLVPTYPPFIGDLQHGNDTCIAETRLRPTPANRRNPQPI